MYIVYMSTTMDETPTSGNSVHMSDPGSELEHVTIYKDDMFVQSVRTVYDENTALYPSLATQKHNGANVMVLPHITQPLIGHSDGLIIRSRDYISKIELLDFPAERYSLKCNGIILTASKDNCFNLDCPKSTGLTEFYEVNNGRYQGFNKPSKNGIFALYVDQLEICYPRVVTLPQRCLVKVTDMENCQNRQLSKLKRPGY